MSSERVTQSLSLRVRKRAKGLCEYCKAPANFASASFHCDHIIPRKSGGKTTLDNLAWTCPWCNSTKHTKTHALDPRTGQRVPLFNPRLKNWNRHFRWSEDRLTIIGRTRTGRATVEALNLNHLGIVNIRMVLRNSSEYSPNSD